MGKKKFQWEADSGEPRDQPPAPRERGRKKREAQQGDALIDSLLAMSRTDVAALPISAETLEAIEVLRELSTRGGVRSGLRRQRLRVAGRLREEDFETLRDAMPSQAGVSPRELALQAVELCRKRLIAGDKEAFEALVVEHPDLDRGELHGLIRRASKEQAAVDERSGKAYRELFALLRKLHGV